MEITDTRRQPGLTIPASPAFREWTRRLARANRLPMSSLIERLLVDHARSSGFADPPPDRGTKGVRP